MLVTYSVIPIYSLILTLLMSNCELRIMNYVTYMGLAIRTVLRDARTRQNASRKDVPCVPHIGTPLKVSHKQVPGVPICGTKSSRSSTWYGHGGTQGMAKVE